MLAVCSVLALIMGLAALPAAWSAAHGGGRTGVFTAEEALSCPRSDVTCSWRGRFTSDDGSVRIEGVLLDSPAPGSVGARVPARYLGPADPSVVYQVEGDDSWIWIVVTSTVAAGYLAAFLVAFARRPAERRPRTS